MNQQNNIKVKVSYPYPGQTDMLIRMLPAELYPGIDFVINPPDSHEKYDYWIVFNFLYNHLSQQAVCPATNVIFVATEPYDVSCYPSDYLKQFGLVLSFEPSILKNNRNALLSPPLSEWFVGKNHFELSGTTTVEKTKLISVVSSNKTDLKGQRKRLEFARAVKNHFGDKIDFYGRGIKPFADKWDVLAQYKYSIAIENSYSDNYFTEKINDCFLAQTFPLYYGCPNLENYFNSDSFIRIDIHNVDRSIGIIKSVIESETHYADHLEAVLESKSKVLGNYNFFAWCAALITERANAKPQAEYELITLRQQMPRTPALVTERINHKLYKFYRKYF
jgi:hypothetical protein